jgi:hypothetical protein
LAATVELRRLGRVCQSPTTFEEETHENDGD